MSEYVSLKEEEVMKNLQGKIYVCIVVSAALNNRRKLFCHGTYWQLLPEVPTGADCGLLKGTYKMFVQFALFVIISVHNCLEKNGAW